MLHRLSVQGISTAKLAERFGLTRNQVIGKLHRYRRRNLLGPIKEERERKQRLGKDSMRSVLRTPARELQRDPDPGFVSHWPARSQCCWPEGNPLEKGFRFCGAPRRGPGPYCTEHHARAYIVRTVPEPA